VRQTAALTFCSVPSILPLAFRPYLYRLATKNANNHIDQMTWSIMMITQIQRAPH